MGKRTILIVDDEMVNRHMLKNLLSDDYDILEAENGQKAMDELHVHGQDISAVVLDIVMPVMNGHDVLRAMKADPALANIPVIVSSSQDGDEAEEKALVLGAQDFIAKPYKGGIIHHRLHNTIQLRETAAMINKVEKDELTGLSSKQFFLERVSEALRQNPEGSYDLVCFGIERFKLINETYGMRKGDDLLRHISNMLKDIQPPVLASRFMADQFFVLVPHRDTYDDAFFMPYFAEIQAFPIDVDVNVNCGVYHIADAETSINVMCDRAQMAADKNKGVYDTLFCMYDDSLRQKIMDEQFVSGSMRTALAERQFHVYYQPKYDLNNEFVAGAEALVRWISPERGFLSPGLFIPLFEQNGFITQLDEYVWKTACRDIRDWMDRGYPPVSVSVNVSRADIYNPKLPDILLAMLAKYRVPIRYLHLEITESAYTDSPEQIIRAVNRLRELGFVIEMDDFGSGYSSLNMLADMPVDVLKLDIGFIQHETGNPSGRGILDFVIRMAKWLDLAMVAEGVETADQIATLRSMDCNYVQGFYFARPMKRGDFDDLLSRSQTTEMLCSGQTACEYVADPALLSGDDAGRVMLIVDDMEINRQTLSSIFAQDFRIVERVNDEDAWEYLKAEAEQVAVVLLSFGAPGIDAARLLERIRGNNRMASLPVLVVAQGGGGDEDRVLSLQADDLIMRPFNPRIIKLRVSHALETRRLRALQEVLSDEAEEDALRGAQQALMRLETLRPHFDLVRLVDPECTYVCEQACEGCNMQACYAVWGKTARCNNCISLRALHEKGRFCKLEYSENSLYFVIAEYVPYEGGGAVIEMVTKLSDEYVENILDKHLLYAKLDSFNRQLNIDPITIGISVGCVSLSESPSCTTHDLINRADRRLYQAKETSRGSVVAEG